MIDFFVLFLFDFEEKNTLYVSIFASSYESRLKLAELHCP